VERSLLELTVEMQAHANFGLVCGNVCNGCEFWTIKAADSKRLNTFEIDMYRRMLRISKLTDHRTNNSVLEVELQPTWQKSNKESYTV